MPGAYYNENEKFAAQWLRNLIGAGLIAPGEVDDRSIRDVRPEDVRGFTQCHWFAGIGVWSYALRQAGWADDREVWTASCPCQGFSAAGKGLAFDDERHLWPEFWRIAEVARPRVVFGEQVASKLGLAWLDLVSADLEAADYAVGAIDLGAAGLGAPHIRQRLWFVAESDDPQRRTDGSRGHIPDGAHTGRTEGSGDSEGRGGVGHGANAHLSVSGEGRQQRSRELVRAGGDEAAGVLANAHVETEGRRGIQGPRESDGAGHGSSCERLEGLRSTDEPEGVAQGDAFSPGPQVGQIDPEQRGPVRVQGAAIGATSALHGPWGGAEWLWCSDGRWRPVESGVTPLAHGVAGRVGKLRAYGNAICAPVAQEVISAYMACRP